MTELKTRLEKAEETFEKMNLEMPHVLTFLKKFQPLFLEIMQKDESDLIPKAEYILYSLLKFVTTEFCLIEESEHYHEMAQMARYEMGEMANPITGEIKNS